MDKADSSENSSSLSSSSHSSSFTSKSQISSGNEQQVTTPLTIQDTQKINCTVCHQSWAVSSESKSLLPKYCTFCGSALDLADRPPSLTPTLPEHVSFIQGHQPTKTVQFVMGSYQILDRIAQGGMGEVFLAYDTTCGRRIALKRIRADLMNIPQLHNRFFKEARVTSQLTHPAIIPIYAIHQEGSVLYYTMPYVEGETLKQIIQKARQLEKQGERLDHTSSSIPALMRVFITVCQAISYAHSKNVLHRDLKPENIIVGKFGEVLILDWGLAKLLEHSKETLSDSNTEQLIQNPSENAPEECSSSQDASSENVPEEIQHPFHQLTSIGKVVGTISYMAPERAKGNPATVQTDIYSLGVILYQMLTLKLPFHRPSLKQFRKTMNKEVFIDPSQMAPYRDVPEVLASVVKKALSPKADQRYQTVSALIHDVEGYIEGRSEWFLAAQLDIKDKSCWEFQENVLIAEHMAIMRHLEVSDWVTLMISKASIIENVKLEAFVNIGEKGHGIGFLLNVPEAGEREHLNDGYCLWIGSDQYKATKLLRNTVEVLSSPDICLFRHEWYRIRIEKVDKNIHFYLNDVLQFSYISHLPLVGTHVGLIMRDADFQIKEFSVFSGSHNIMVNCLAVPDAFLAHNNYATALHEYRRIGYSFPGRAEGREALFRAGVTLLEQGRKQGNSAEAYTFFDLALAEFDKLHNTPGAPLEYLGKALVYQTLKDYDEELKCYEIACRRYKQHLLFPVLQEHIIYRMHESSRQHRVVAYQLILLVVRQLPSVSVTQNSIKLFTNLKKHWEKLPFILMPEAVEEGQEINRSHFFAIKLAFWLDHVSALVEMAHQFVKPEDLDLFNLINILFCLLRLDHVEEVIKLCTLIEENNLMEHAVVKKGYDYVKAILEDMDNLSAEANADSPFKTFFTVFHLNEVSTRKMDDNAFRFFEYLLDKAMELKCYNIIHVAIAKLKDMEMSEENRLQLDSYVIEAYMWQNEWKKAWDLIHQYPMDLLVRDTSILFFLYGCLLYVLEGKEIGHIHFSGILDVAFPRTWSLGSHYVKRKIAEDHPWFKKAFLWEKKALKKQLALYDHCIMEI